MFLFLDFDGVLHSYPIDPHYNNNELFQHTPLLWLLLRRHPELKVVISSSWRENFSIDYLIDFITYGGGEDLSNRVIGITPVINGVERDRECFAWLNENGYIGARWLALDDQPSFFMRYRDHLYAVNPKSGLTPDDIFKISAKITAL